MDKIEVLARVLQARDRGLTMVFCQTKRAADQVATALATRGFAVATVHGDLGQGQRERALRAFRSGKVDVLTATEVAARGLDVDDVTHVVNYECPDDDKTYVHRIGRTGRAGQAGVAVTFVDWRDMHRWKLINDALGLGQPEPEETYSTSEHLYTELDIPREATGTLPRAMRDRAGLEAEAVEDIGETGKIRSPRARARLAPGQGGRTVAGGAGRSRARRYAGRRRQRRRRGGRQAADAGRGRRRHGGAAGGGAGQTGRRKRAARRPPADSPGSRAKPPDQRAQLGVRELPRGFVQRRQVRFAAVSTPTSLELPDGVRRTTIMTGRGPFAALEAAPPSGVCEREPALLVPGYTGSKEDFLAILGLLADGGRQVVAIDMRGQFETPGPGRSGRLLRRGARGGHRRRHPTRPARAPGRALLRRADGPGGRAGRRRAGRRRPRLVHADEFGPGRADRAAGGGTARPCWPPSGVADGEHAGPDALAGRDLRALAGLPGAAGRRGRRPGPIVAFLARADAQQRPGRAGPDGPAPAHRTGPDGRTGPAGRDPVLVLYGEDDNAWSPGRAGGDGQAAGARRVCIPAACTPPPSRPRPRRRAR